jgi:hypothetical protein
MNYLTHKIKYFNLKNIIGGSLFETNFRQIINCLIDYNNKNKNKYLRMVI